MNGDKTQSDDTARVLVGVDGCRAGWIAAIAADSTSDIQLELFDNFAAIIERAGRSGLIVVDIPIGLLDERRKGGRSCDVEARKLLRKRRSSVFNPPSRDALSATSYDQARRFGLSQQGFAILPKIREVDMLMSPALQVRVRESHPELAFTGLAGRPMAHHKRGPSGRAERLDTLKLAEDVGSSRWFRSVEDRFATDCHRFRRRDVALDDIVDAHVMLAVAASVAKGSARRLPVNPPIDTRGLHMEMWY